jgi:hypothetical protein
MTSKRITLDKVSNFDKLEVLKISKKILADEERVLPKEISKSLFVVLNRICELPTFSCKISIRNDDTDKLKTFIEKWTTKFINGYFNQSSKRVSNPIGTIHDSLIDEIIISRLPFLTKELQLHIKHGHRISMSAENIAGYFLEEYISVILLKYGWHCCWGETMKSIDFCSKSGDLLQVKNSDNSENSSSKAIRNGTEIQHWFRRFAKNGNTNWPTLNKLVGITKKQDLLSEKNYKEFIKSVISKNPKVLYVEDEKIWK